MYVEVVHCVCGIKFPKYSLDLFPYDVNSDRENGKVKYLLITFILGAFEKIWKATVNCVLSVCLSVCMYVCLSVYMEQFGFHWMEFNEI